MKRVLFPILALSLLLSGCLDVGMNVKIGANWDGDLSLKMEMLDQMFQMLASPQAAQMGADFSLLDEAKLRSLAEEHGGKVRKFTNTVEAGIRKIDILATVPDLRKLFEAAGGGQVSIKELDGAWVWNLMDNESMNTFTKMEDELLEQQLSMLLPALTGLKVKLDVQVPHLLETNLTKVNATTARFEIDFDRDIAGKQGQAAVNAFKSLLTPKFVKFNGVK